MAIFRYESERGRKGWRLQFRDVTKRNKTLWLGDVPEYSAQETKAHIEHLLAAAKANRPPELATSGWLGSIDDEFRNKLARYGLCESVETRHVRDLTLGQWLDLYIDE